jgi:hypothetical protein
LRDGQVDGGRSSAGRAPGCDPGCRGFESHRPPQIAGPLAQLVEQETLNPGANYPWGVELLKGDVGLPAYTLLSNSEYPRDYLRSESASDNVRRDRWSSDCRSRKVRAPLGTLPGNTWASAASADRRRTVPQKLHRRQFVFRAQARDSGWARVKW